MDLTLLPLRTLNLIKKYNQKYTPVRRFNNLKIAFWSVAVGIIYLVVLTLFLSLALKYNQPLLQYFAIGLIILVFVGFLLSIAYFIFNEVVIPWHFDKKSNKYRNEIDFVYNKYRTILIFSNRNEYKSSVAELKDAGRRRIYAAALLEKEILSKQNSMNISGMRFFGNLFVITGLFIALRASGVSVELLTNSISSQLTGVTNDILKIVPKSTQDAILYIVFYGSEFGYLWNNYRYWEGFIYEAAALKLSSEMTP